MTTIAQLIASHKAALAKMREMEDGPDAAKYDAAVEAESAALEALARVPGDRSPRARHRDRSSARRPWMNSSFCVPYMPTSNRDRAQALPPKHQAK